MRVSIGNISSKTVIRPSDPCGCISGISCQILKVGRIIEIGVGIIRVKASGRAIRKILLLEITGIAAAEIAGLKLTLLFREG